MNNFKTLHCRYFLIKPTANLVRVVVCLMIMCLLGSAIHSAIQNPYANNIELFGDVAPRLLIAGILAAVMTFFGDKIIGYTICKALGVDTIHYNDKEIELVFLNSKTIKTNLSSIYEVYIGPGGKIRFSFPYHVLWTAGSISNPDELLKNIKNENPNVAITKWPSLKNRNNDL